MHTCTKISATLIFEIKSITVAGETTRTWGLLRADPELRFCREGLGHGGPFGKLRFTLCIWPEWGNRDEVKREKSLWLRDPVPGPVYFLKRMKQIRVFISTYLYTHTHTNTIQTKQKASKCHQFSF